MLMELLNNLDQILFLLFFSSKIVIFVLVIYQHSLKEV